MRKFALFWLSFVAFAVHAQSKPPTLEKLCGKLQYLTKIPVKNSPNDFEDKTKNLSRVAVRLYHAESDRPCCDGLALANQTTTDRWGAFHLRQERLAGGMYWIVVQPNRHEYKLLLQYDPKANSTQLCSETYFQLDDAGNFAVGETITVD